MSEHEKQLSGEWYNSNVPEIVELQKKSRLLMREFNAELDRDKRFNIMKKWFKEVGENSYIEPNFFCDFGCHIILGKGVYFNTNCTVLDSAYVTVEDDTWIGSGVQLCTPTHPIHPDDRMVQATSEKADAIKIEKRCWIGSGAIILGGVTIGEGSTIGAGSVVTKNIPPYSVAVGNTSKVIRKLEKRN